MTVCDSPPLVIADEQIEENAYIIVQQLIHHTECMGPALAGDALGLSNMYRDALQRAENVGEERIDYGRLISMESTTSSSRSLMKQGTSAGIYGDTSVLTFYTTLMRLLACSASRPTNDKLPSGKAGLSVSHSANRHKQSAIRRTRSILQNLIKAEEVVAILSFKSCGGREKGLNAFHKEAALLFFGRVYGIPGPDLLLQLLTNAFMPDVKLALQLAQEVWQAFLIA